MNLEKQRQFILSGKVYNDLTPELIKARENTVFLTNKYNDNIVYNFIFYINYIISIKFFI